MGNHLFHTFNDTRRQYVYYWGKDTGTARLDLQHHMGRLGFDSLIIEVDGSLSKEQAYTMAKAHATRFGFPVITDKEDIARLKAINKETDVYRKEINKVITKLKIPSALKESLRDAVSDVVESYRGRKQNEP